MAQFALLQTLLLSSLGVALGLLLGGSLCSGILLAIRAFLAERSREWSDEGRLAFAVLEVDGEVPKSSVAQVVGGSKVLFGGGGGG